MAKVNKNDDLIYILNLFEKMFCSPLYFLKPHPKNGNEILERLRTLNGVLLESNKKNNFQSMSSPIVTKDMDDCQIWQQIEMSNFGCIENLIKESSFLLSYKPRYLEIRLKDFHYPPCSLNTFKTKPTLPKSDMRGYKRTIREKMQIKKPLHNSIVDDNFFKLKEMEEFLLSEEAKELGNSRQKTFHIDYFCDDFTAPFDKGNLNYKEFFNGEDETIDFDYRRDVRIAANSLDLEQTDKSLSDCKRFSPESCVEAFASQSSHQIKQQQLEKIIHQYEASVIGQKLWQMQGEVPASKRPKNSLLEELLEFDPTITPAPAVTEKTTKCLESIIIHRIKNKIWDDVVRVVRPVNNMFEYKRYNLNDQEKSKQSLMQHYENQYSTALEILTSHSNKSVLDQSLKEHRHIKKELQDLILKLDTLSNFHLSPQPVAPEAKIVLQTPAMETEECTQVAFNTSRSLKPEEIYCSTNVLVGKTERSHVEKHRDFRKKKTSRRTSTKICPKRANRKRNVTKVNTHDDYEVTRSSTKFFSKLHEIPLCNSLQTRNKI